MRIKPFILFFLVLFPVCIYLFLQTFGENRFTIPEMGDISDFMKSSECENVSAIVNQIEFDSSAFTLLEIVNIEIKNTDQYKIDLNRISERFGEFYRLISISTQAGHNSDKRLQYIPVDEGFLKCFPAFEKHLQNEELSQTLEGSNWFILVDNKEQIRGFYQIEEPEDIDRLVIEFALLTDSK